MNQMTPADLKTLKKLKTQIKKELKGFDLDSITTREDIYYQMKLSYIKRLKFRLDPEFDSLLTDLENACDLSIIRYGFVSDKSFAKWYLEKYTPVNSLHQESLEPTDVTPQIHIHLDTTVSPHLDIFENRGADPKDPKDPKEHKGTK